MNYGTWFSVMTIIKCDITYQYNIINSIEEWNAQCMQVIYIFTNWVTFRYLKFSGEKGIFIK